MPKHIYRRGNKLWCRLKDGSRGWISKPTPFAVGEECDAARYVKKAQERIDARDKKGSE